ncbi:M56 family metallopeptidase [Paenibacillus sp. UNC451MF]|uniref:M56 family metallopeptidase n=1 Tax=Paenibacillus sp. UNC451MF TaxID=1449063 RepID=UPI000565E8F6|nr:M56 family metallopeptidase [Paenibacillus sp. UNC451MF]
MWENRWENRSRLIFISGMLLAGLMLVQMGMYIMHTLAGWEIRYNVIQLCHTVMKSLGIQWVGYVLNAIVFYTFFMSVWIAAKQLYLSRMFNNKLLARRHELLTREINQRFAGTSPGEQTIIVIDNAAPLAFAMGFFKPRIVLSTGLKDLLDSNELEAVVHHEMFHRKHGDPLKTFLMSLLASVMWYIPILKSFHHNYKIVREVLADNYAIDKSGSSIHLGSALLKLLKGKAPAPMPVSHVSFSDTSINLRIRQLLEPQADFPLNWPFTPAMISLQVLFVLCSMFVLVMH